MSRLLYLSADPGVPVLGHKGASVHLREVARALRQAGADVLVASPRIQPEGDTLGDDIPLALVPAVLPRKLVLDAVQAAMDRQATAVLELARAHRAEAIYERFSLFSDAGSRAARALGVPHVVELNAPLRQEAERFRTLPHPGLALDVERAVLGGASRILVVSPALVAHVTALGVADERVEVVPNGVAPVDAAPGPRGEGPGLLVGFAGSLKPWHGITTLLAACALAGREVPRLTLEVIGHGPLAGEVTRGAVAPAALLTPGALPHEQTLRYMTRWDIGVAPYTALGDFYFSPLKVLEYMATGICPVASALGELPELLGHGTRGVLVPPGDAPALARALCELAADPERRAQLGAAGRRYVATHRGWGRNAERILAAVAGAREAARA